MFWTFGRGHCRGQMPVGPFGVPHETQHVEHLGPDRVHPERIQSDGRTVVPEVCRGKPMERVPKIVVGRHTTETRIASPMAITTLLIRDPEALRPLKICTRKRIFVPLFRRTHTPY